MTEPIKVLVVDDDVEVCSLVKYRLTLGKEEEFIVTSISTDFERLSSPSAFDGLDCLVLDLWLTEKGILEEFPMAHKVFHWAKAGNPSMSIILFSAVIGLQHRQDLEDEADFVMAKPSIDTISDVIKDITHRRRTGDWPVLPQET